jgi:alpha-beta hydrolase superfamily lysophospholipase
MPSTTDELTARDGTRLLVRRWPAVGEPVASMLLVHGLGDHSGRYERVGDAFAAAGIDVTAFDLRGQGGSGGRPGDVDRWGDFLDDVEDRLAVVRSEARSRPVILLGHSLGGLIGVDYVLDGRPSPDLLVLSSPSLDDGLPRWQHLVVPLVAVIAPRLALPNAWGGTALTRDPEVGRRAEADPARRKRTTTRLGREGFAAQDRVRCSVAGLTALPVETFVSHGSADTLVPATASEPLGRLEGVTRRVYPDLRHETYFEPEGPEVVADVIAWLGQRLGRPSV